MASLPLSHRNWPRVQNNINDNYCVQSVTGLKDFACVHSQKSLNHSPVMGSETVFLPVNSCCKCSFCHRVATKERRQSQLLLQSHRNKICERCFLCRSLEFCKYCHKSPNCCKVHAFSYPGSVLTVQSPTLSSVHSTHGVHSGGQRGQTDGFTEGYKNPPVPRRLVGESHVPPNLSPAYTDFGSSLSRTRLAGEQGEVRTGPKTALADLNRQDIVNPVRCARSGSSCPSWTSNSHRKASPLRSTSYETHTVALEEQLEVFT